MTTSDESGLLDLVWSLSAATLTYLGHGILPGEKKPRVSLDHARKTIATLDMLKAKTEGNRTEEESKVFDEMLYNLRLTFVKTEEEMKKAPAKDVKEEESSDPTAGSEV